MTNDIKFDGTLEEAIDKGQTEVEQPQLVPNPAVEAVKELEQKKQDKGEIVTLRSGLRVRFRPVGQNIIRSAQAKVIDPPVPTQPHPSAPDDPEKFIENPMHPDYQIALAEAQKKRIEAVLDVLFLRGLELIDPMPEDEKWIHDLVILNLITKEQADQADEYLKELWYKRWIVDADNEILDRLHDMTGISQEGVKAAMSAFKSNS